MRAAGVRYLDCYSVDNAVAKVADPCFIGACVQADAQVGARVVAKTSASERVGVFAEYAYCSELAAVYHAYSVLYATRSSKSASSSLPTITMMQQCNWPSCLRRIECVPTHTCGACRRGGRHHVVEYSEISAEAAKATDDHGRLRFNWANICMHFFSVDWLEAAAAHLEQQPQYAAAPLCCAGLQAAPLALVRACGVSLCQSRRNDVASCPDGVDTVQVSPCAQKHTVARRPSRGRQA